MSVRDYDTESITLSVGDGLITETVTIGPFAEVFRFHGHWVADKPILLWQRNSSHDSTDDDTFSNMPGLGAESGVRDISTVSNPHLRYLRIASIYPTGVYSRFWVICKLNNGSYLTRTADKGTSIPMVYFINGTTNGDLEEMGVATPDSGDSSIQSTAAIPGNEIDYIALETEGSNHDIDIYMGFDT
ncbi:MAG: hypothetical protein Unbinned4234contig1003_19 [Prokaryotic dsDNA virus sp.]|nr:MAG: hypothetical protein Unbinned4234contig1003_19 [Prokaryotic dsDNA virus sp.]|tara:strand:- start:2906 stop:3466 length:561 start_codon:yes stop_codon:yes gene_type:complete